MRWCSRCGRCESTTRQVALQALAEPAVLSLRLTERRPLVAPTVMARPQQAPFMGVALKTPILHEGETLGELELWFDPGQIDRALADRRQATMKLAALQVLLRQRQYHSGITMPTLKVWMQLSCPVGFHTVTIFVVVQSVALHP